VSRWQRQGIYVRQIGELGLLLNERMLEGLKRSRREIARSSKEEMASGLADLSRD